MSTSRAGAAPLVVAVALLASVLLVRPALGVSEVVVRITSSLDPSDVTVTPGTVVTWVNDDGARHRIRAVDGELDSGNLEPGQRYSWTPTTEGVVRYVDDRDRDDPAYHGVVRVVTTTAPPAPAPEPAPTDEPPAPGTEPPPTTAPAPTAPTAPSAATVGMGNRVFSPREVTIAVGGTVTWRNDDDRDHTVTGDAFDSGLMPVGATFVWTFPQAGRFAYLCLIHPDMTGTVVVEGAGVTTGPAPTPAGPSPTASSPTTVAPGPTGTSTTSPSSPASTPPPSSPVPTTAVPGPAVAPRAEVGVLDFAFSPSRIEVAAGGSVTFANTGRAPHTVTARDGAFDSGIMMAGARFTHRFTRAGSYPFVCTLHPEMTGTVVVRPAGASPDRTTEVLSGGAAAPEEAPSSAASGADPSAAPPGAGEPATAGGAPEASSQLRIVDDAFEPDDLEVEAGTSLTWTNTGAAPHTVTASDGAFDSGILQPGATWTTTIDEPGTYAYVCLVHPDMRAVIRVVAPLAAVTDDESAATIDRAGDRVPGERSTPPTWVLQLGMLAVFVLGLAAFTVASGRVSSMDRS